MGLGLGSLVRKAPIIGNPIADAAESVFAPGLSAKKKAAQATGAWQGLEVPETPNLTFGNQGTTTAHQGNNIADELAQLQGLSQGGTRDENGNVVYSPTPDITPYDVGATLPQVDYGTSAAGGMRNAYEDVTDPYATLKSAWGDVGPSAFEGTQSAATDFQYDPQALAGQRGAAGYFEQLGQTGTDPIAEADYAAKKAEAEQGRKANTDAALQALEMRGQGNAGGQLNARLGGLQDTANAEYQAGLNFAAMKAQRRDAATAQGAGIQSSIGGALEKSAMDKAAAEDKYNFYKLSGMDDFAAKRASGLDQFEGNKAAGEASLELGKAGGTNQFQQGQASLEDAYKGHAKDVENATNVYNTNRAHEVGDTNTGLKNQTNTFNKVTAPQTTFGQNVTKTSGIAGAYGGEAAQSAASDAALVGNLKSVAGGLSGTPTGGAAPAYAAPGAPSAIPTTTSAGTTFNWPSPADPNKQNPKFYG